MQPIVLWLQRKANTGSGVGWGAQTNSKNPGGVPLLEINLSRSVWLFIRTTTVIFTRALPVSRGAELGERIELKGNAYRGLFAGGITTSSVPVGRVSPESPRSPAVLQLHCSDLCWGWECGEGIQVEVSKSTVVTDKTAKS